MSKESKALAKARQKDKAQNITDKTQSVKEEYAKRILDIKSIISAIEEAASLGYESTVIKQDKAIDCTTTEQYTQAKEKLESFGFTVGVLRTTVPIPELQNRLLPSIENLTGDAITIKFIKISWPKKVLHGGR